MAFVLTKFICVPQLQSTNNLFAPFGMNSTQTTAVLLFQADLTAVTNGIKNPSSVTAAQAGAAAVIGIESYFLFNVGEIIGRGSLIGYDVGPNGFKEKH